MLEEEKENHNKTSPSPLHEVSYRNYIASLCSIQNDIVNKIVKRSPFIFTTQIFFSLSLPTWHPPLSDCSYWTLVGLCLTCLKYLKYIIFLPFYHQLQHHPHLFTNTSISNPIPSWIYTNLSLHSLSPPPSNGTAHKTLT